MVTVAEKQIKQRSENMHSKPLKLSARALEILWACHIPSELSKGACVERGPFEFDAWARRRGKKKKMLKREGKKKNKKKTLWQLQTTRQRHICKCTSVDVVPAAFEKVVVWRLCQRERRAQGWNDSARVPLVPSYGTCERSEFVL